jgi:lipoate-protein ligase A
VSEVGELYDYSELRQLTEATMLVVDVDRPVVVLGGSQSSDVLAPGRLGGVALRRRRGGGGLVLLQPGDLWIDWWIPTDDPRWSHDVHVSSILVGSWWRDVLSPLVRGEAVVFRGSLEGEVEHRVACFAGRGPGEVFVNDRKAVGLTQWRVREGIFLSSVLHSKSSTGLIELLRHPPKGLAEALDHHLISTLGIEDLQSLIDALRTASGPWRFRRLSLTA